VVTVNFTACEQSELFFCRLGHLVEFAARDRMWLSPGKSGGQKKVTGSSFAGSRWGLLARCFLLPDLHRFRLRPLLSTAERGSERQA